ncbi:[acyl-carrier-protein] S-malonyltransferase [Aerococcus agrisoli]|uniref:Malonyl CoA-acyl carrier protein transacylase n=1 Tax=Aerococcus agrisoli TaxID=2487350 RepID=A0A3N4GPY5_9LACT|nr:ACP S-malonyltransferase [Aerococcus agrisoli]RPA64969.1 [acyl-carrier-protein] S-malonyltransferase [Aerococcus agrisoli]
MTIAFLYAGQGAQYTGMGQDILNHHPELTTYFDQASEILGYDMKALCFEDEEKINQTEYTQPAILTVSTAFSSLLKEAGIEADYVAGLSLGEYAALVESGVLSFEAAIDVVSHRGRFMQAAVPAGVGKMVAVMKMDRKVIEDICLQVSYDMGKYVAPANYNTPKQIVIGGYADAVDEAVSRLAENGAKKMVELNVSGPFHTELLAEASKQLDSYLDYVLFNAQQIPVISNTTALPHEDGHIKDMLVEQVMQPVKWSDSIEYLIAQGVDTVIEIGPGKTLSSFMKQINKDIRVFRVEDEETLQATIVGLKG